MIHVANTSVAGCGVVTGTAGVLGDIVCIMSCGAGVFGDVMRIMGCGAGVFGDVVRVMGCGAGVLGDVVRVMSCRAGVSAWTIIARRATVFRHATVIIATIMSAGRGSGRVAMAGMVIVARRATTMVAVGTVIATRVASRCSATTGTAVPSAIPAAGTVAATAAVAAATTSAVATATTSAVATAAAVAATTVVSHGTLDMPRMRSGIEPPRRRGHRQSTRADRQDEDQRSPTSVDDRRIRVRVQSVMGRDSSI
jgi:hypothetical protein